MKTDEYISLIQSLEKYAAENRSSYQFRVLLLTALGYGYFIALILLLLAPFPFVLAFLLIDPDVTLRVLALGTKLWWVLIPGLGIYFGFLGSAVRSITAKVPDPGGAELKRSDAPELFAFVTSTCSELRAKKPSRILLDDSFNAGIVTMPRFGIFGRRVLLSVGLPLMKALSADQFKAVLAHEVGHISGKHGAFAKWAYQMREAWGRLIESEEVNEHKFSALYKRFVDWFFPYFTAYSFVLMREHEKDADREAVKLVGKRPLGEALILMETKGSKISNEFWTEVHKENIARDTPSERIFSRMLTSLAFVSEEGAASSLSEAIAIPTDFNDSHPSLADRLRNIGYWTSGDLPEMPRAVEIDAATAFLGSAAERFTAEFDASWDEQAAETWKQRHDHFQESQKRIAEIQEARNTRLATLEELRELWMLLTDTEGWEAALPVIEEAAERFPNEGVVLFNLGVVRLSQKDDVGLGYLQKAVELESAYKFDADNIAFDYLRSQGRLDEARGYMRAIDEQNEIFEKAQKERLGASFKDDWEMHDLTKEFLDTIPPKLAGLDEIVSLYAANKKVEHMPEIPFRTLFVEMRTKRSGDATPSAILEIITKRVDTGEFHYVVILDQQWTRVYNQLVSMPGTKFYSSESS